VVRVAQHVREMALVDRVVVATDATAIEAAVRKAGFEAILTAPGHQSGTDRVVEVARAGAYASFDLVVNVQGDEPFLPREALAGALGRLGLGDEIGTAAAPLTAADASDPGRVKVVSDGEGRALYFSRAMIPAWCDGPSPPSGTYWQHLGVYAFQRAALERWASLEPAPLEAAERLEQLRALYHGMRIGVARLSHGVPPGIDTPEDLARAEVHWRQRHEVLR